MANATEILTNIRAAYTAAKLVNDLMVMYQTNGSGDAIFSQAERVELGAVAAHFAALVTELEANHAAAIGRTAA